MLAVKLHKKPTPWLGRGSHLVPIVKWDAGKLQLRRWIKLLGGMQKQIRFLTLVQIPDEHPVRIVFAYGASNFIKRVYWCEDYEPLRDWPVELKQALQEWWDATRGEPGGLMADEPELILGKKLPKSCIKWTKDIRLLYRRKPVGKRPRVRS